MRESFVFYQSFHNAAKNLTTEQYGAFYMALNTYVFMEEEPEIDDPIVRAMFEMARPQIDATERKRTNGSKGGAPKGNDNAKKTTNVENTAEESDEKTTNVELKTTLVNFETTNVENKTSNEECRIENVECRIENVECRIENVECVSAEAEPRAEPTHTKKVTSRFIKPTPEDINQFCLDNNIQVDTKRFIDYYTSIGWVVGKARTPMKDWKAAVRNWARSDKTYNAQASPPPTYLPEDHLIF